MKQKVALVSAISRGGSVLFLDEPTLGLNVESSVALRRELRQLVDTESVTVMLSSHDMKTIEQLCDRVIIVDDGEVIADDSIQNLIELFDSQSYEITIATQLPSRVRRSIERSHSVNQWEETANGDIRIRLLLEDSSAIYELFSTLERHSCTIFRLKLLKQISNQYS
jgi:ABC-2 type transport system ATP-binding protein